jgi:hypothetical protein
MAGLLDFLTGDNAARLAAGAGALYGAEQGIQSARDLGAQAMTRAETAATDVVGQTQFKPFTVTSGVGGVSTTPEGGLTTTLSPEQQALQQQLQQFGSGAFGMLGSADERAAEQANIIGMLTQGGQGGREAEIMQRLQAAVAPEQERQRMALEERLFSQGRLGVATNQYGGTPEQLALEKAIAEQQAGFGVSAIEQARADQQLQSSQTLAGLQETRARLGMLGETGLAALQQSYMPQQALLNTLSPAINLSNIASTGQARGAQFGTSLLQSGLTAQQEAERTASNLEQQRIQGITNLLAGQIGAEGQVTQTGLLQGILQNILGNGGNTAPLNDAANTQAALDFYLGN